MRSRARAGTSSASASASPIFRRRTTCRKQRSAPSSRASTATPRRRGSTSCARPVPIHLREARRFAFDLTDLEKLITPRTRLLILNYPHNPTGGLLSRKELEEIAAILKGHPQVWVYADEIYSRLAYAGEFFSIAQVPGMYERSIISDGASKTWAMTGWRIGFTSNPVLAPVFTRWIT